jgi:hypothetical protein
LQPLLEVEVERVQQAEPAPAGRRLLLRLCLLVFFGGLLLLLSSRPADAAERQELRLLDPVGTTSKATAKKVGSLAGRAAGSGSSTVATAARVIRQTAAPQPRPAVETARATARSTAKRGAPAVTSPVRRVAPPVGSALLPVGSALASVGSAVAPVTQGVGGLVDPLVPVGLVRLPGGLLGPAVAAPATSAGPATELMDPDSAGPADLLPAASQTSPASAGSPGDRPVRSWPALAGAVHLPGVPASAELPAGGPDPLSTAWGAGLVLAAVTAFLLPPGLRGRGRARLERAGVLSRSYLPLVSPA